MTLPTSTDLDGFDSEMIFYGNPGAVMISGEMVHILLCTMA